MINFLAIVGSSKHNKSGGQQELGVPAKFLPIKARVIEISDGNEENSEVIIDVPKKLTRKRKARPDSKTNAKKQKLKFRGKVKDWHLLKINKYFVYIISVFYVS